MANGIIDYITRTINGVETIFFPRTKEKAITDDNGVRLDVKLGNYLESERLNEYELENVTPIADAELLGGQLPGYYASKNDVAKQRQLIEGFVAGTLTINDDGSVTEVNDSGTKTIVRQADGSVITTLTTATKIITMTQTVDSTGKQMETTIQEVAK